MKTKQVVVPKDTALIIYQVPKTWAMERFREFTELCRKLDLKKEHIKQLVITNDVKITVVKNGRRLVQ